ncbi:MAG: dihydroorotate dehydrogenase electron transfer subunit [Planctomycetaceae bacterium]|jgi:dihydroorotate dehydrogenase electron transfer subunit|nr:dihydroorotate dehydrogenase electron transfer subunit [Planctomycetaceae bacterium]
MSGTQRNIWHGSGIVETNIELAEKTFRLSLNVQEPLPVINAGQFVMLRLPGGSDPLLGRPFAVYRVSENILEVVYLVVGKMTSRLAELQPGNRLDFWTPLGNGFSLSDAAHTIMVAGGIGQTPFFMLAENLCQTQTESRCTLLYGTRTASRIVCMEDFEKLGIEIHLAAEDGSIGYHGFVTDLISKVYQPGESTRILCCGPHPMLHAAFQVARQFDLPCEVSLETSMSCGLGICYGCVVKCRCEADTWDYRRTCVDGPVFDAYRLCW